VVAHIAEQEFWGGQLNRLGVAPETLHRRNLTAADLGRQIKTVLERPQMRERCVELAAQMREENGVANAVAALEQHYCKQDGGD
jgi:UDP:flavonoid glycosyltransferase YjiC (YdhE family)